MTQKSLRCQVSGRYTPADGASNSNMACPATWILNLCDAQRQRRLATRPRIGPAKTPALGALPASVKPSPSLAATHSPCRASSTTALVRHRSRCPPADDDLRGLPGFRRLRERPSCSRHFAFQPSPLRTGLGSAGVSRARSTACRTGPGTVLAASPNSEQSRSSPARADGPLSDSRFARTS
jgi:hypothetical protein